MAVFVHVFHIIDASVEAVALKIIGIVKFCDLFAAQPRIGIDHSAFYALHNRKPALAVSNDGLSGATKIAGKRFEIRWLELHGKKFGVILRAIILDFFNLLIFQEVAYNKSSGQLHSVG